MSNSKVNKKKLSAINEIISILIKALFKICFGLFIYFLKRLKKRMRISLTFKITTVYCFIFSIILFLLSLGIIGGFWFNSARSTFSLLSGNNEVVEAYMKNHPSIPKDIINKRAKKQNIIVAIYNSDKKIIFSTDKNHKIINSNYNFALSPFIEKEISKKNKTYYIRSYKTLSNEYRSTSILFQVLSITDILAIFITILISSKATRKMLLPIQTMTKTAKNISANALETRIDIIDSQDELKELAETFNEMLNRLQTSYEQQNQFVSDASHELRTPISVIQGYANLLDRWGKEDPEVLQESITAIKSEAEGMKSLIEKLLFLARGDKKTQKVIKETFWINELLEETIKETRLIDTDHTIINESNVQAQIFADKALVKEALRILIENSIKYTPKGGYIKMNSLIAKKNLIISIEDTGIGIPEEDIPFIFDRFYRSDKSRTKETGGNGLGLSIAKWIVDNHNWYIDVISKLNTGTKISIIIPLDDNSQS